MRRAMTVQQDISQIGTIKDLASVFEGIASMKLAQIKNQVTSSKQFFSELWWIYSQLRVNPAERLTADQAEQAEAKKEKLFSPEEETAKKDLFMLVTSEGGLSGDIDERIIETMLQEFKPEQHEIIVIGGHGATLLAQRKIAVSKIFKLPEGEQSFDVDPITKELARYKQIKVFYETYVSLSRQEAASIELIKRVQALSAEVVKGQEIISSIDYVFEPSLEEVIEYMERIMIQIALSQVILESKLAQYASRFNAMSAANKKAEDLRSDLKIEYHRAKRAENDERTREIINSLKNV